MKEKIKIKVNFTVPTKDFLESEHRELNVTLHIPDVIYGQFEYSVVIPDYIFNELKDTEHRFSTEYNQNNKDIYRNCASERTLTNVFRKTQIAKSIDKLTEYFSDITHVILNRYSAKKFKREKKIFINFSKSLNQNTEDSYSYAGERVGISFNYFTGYKHYNDNENKLFFRVEEYQYYTSLMYIKQDNFHSGMHNTANVYLIKTKKQQDQQFFLLGKTKEIESKYKIIEWTEEREEYLESILQKLNKIGDDLNIFLSDMDENKIELLMKQDIKLLK